MKRYIQFSSFVQLCCVTALVFVGTSLGGAYSAYAGNPDRQGEAGAYELTIDPWARGVVLVNASNIVGVEATYLNPAGVAFMKGKTEIGFVHTNYLQGSGVGINAGGIASKLNENSYFGISIMAFDFGKINKTTESQPDGTGSTYSPSFFNIGVSYAYRFKNQVSVGVTARVVSEGTDNVTATGIAVDAGIQYNTGKDNNVHFGVVLKNVGTPMTFSGDGISTVNTSKNGYTLTVDQRTKPYELPSALNIGVSYDVLMPMQKINIGANFTSNSFSRDAIIGSVEYSFKTLFAVRAGYTTEVGSTSVAGIGKSVYTGFAAGASLGVPLSKDKSSGIQVDYAFRATNPFSGSHTLGLKLTF